MNRDTIKDFTLLLMYLTSWEESLVPNLYKKPDRPGFRSQIRRTWKGYDFTILSVYMDAQFEKDRRCNVDYDKAGHPRKATRHQSPSLEMDRRCTNPVLSDILGKKEIGVMTEEAIIRKHI